MGGAGHQVYLLCGKTAPDEPAWATEEGVVVRCVRVMPDALLRRLPPSHYLPQALFYLVAPPVILFYLRRWRIERIRDSMSPVPGLGILAPFLGRRGIVVAHILFGGTGGWRRLYPPCYAWLGALAERLLLHGRLGYRWIVTDAPWVAQDIARRGAPGLQVKAVENGVDPDRFVQRPARGRLRRLVCAARFVEHKGLLDLVGACRRLRDRGVDFEMDLFGGGPLEDAVRRDVARHGLGALVRIQPPLTATALARRLAEFDLYVMASRSEGLPVILLEAMAARLPVVVAARPYATSVVDGSLVRFYDPADPDGLAEAIAWAFAHPHEAEVQAARARAFVERFTWDRTAEEEARLLGLLPPAPGPGAGPAFAPGRCSASRGG